MEVCGVLWKALAFWFAKQAALGYDFHGVAPAVNIPSVPHGFRSSFRDWTAECTDAPHTVMEAALAHTVPNATEAAYFRSDLFDKRRKLMEAWEAYLIAGLY